MDKIEIIVNGMEFQEIPNPEFRLYGRKSSELAGFPVFYEELSHSMPMPVLA